MTPDLTSILVFTLTGKFAHFRKFYTNASSLSYLLPPRTVIIGMLASLLKIPRDGYYDILNEANCQVSVAVAETATIKKNTQSVNMLHPTYYRFLVSGNGNSANMHTQNKLELLLSGPAARIEYVVYIAMATENPDFIRLEQTLSQQDNGYGLYLGQRQFRASLSYRGTYGSADISFLPEADALDTVCSRENVLDIVPNPHTTIITEHMPVHMKPATTGKKKKETATGRETTTVRQVLFEQNGKRLHGRFKNCWLVNGKIISFY